jgi:hypothetical protein
MLHHVAQDPGQAPPAKGSCPGHFPPAFSPVPQRTCVQGVRWPRAPLLLSLPGLTVSDPCVPLCVHDCVSETSLPSVRGPPASTLCTRLPPAAGLFSGLFITGQVCFFNHWAQPSTAPHPTCSGTLLMDFGAVMLQTLEGNKTGAVTVCG